MALPGVYDTFQYWSEKYQTVWIYSDPHFNDNDLANGIKNRPSAEEQVKKINTKCGRRDALIILGDIGDIEYIRQLRAGYKILIMGNHDAGVSNYKRKIVKRVFDQNVYTEKEALDTVKKLHPNYNVWVGEEYSFHEPFTRYNVYSDNKLFDEVYEGPLMIGEKLLLSHEPVDVSWAFNIHGHDHAGFMRTNHLNVCSDIINYEPVNLNQLLKNGLMSKVQSIHRDTIDRATKRKRGN